MFSALFELLTGNFLFFALHFDSRSVFPKPLSAKEERECFERRRQRISLSNTISVLWHTL